ncbi:MAG TPA: ATP-binding cassette domain-containing protein [Verrucomicrobiales bacterium]|nr:ATP-binding cassette domain-containing protein [Verrucomicrobiales bacterium]
MAALSFENLSKHFTDERGHRTTALREIDLDVKDGEMLVVVGPSGCGKSTLLRLIAGLEESNTGTIKIDGKIVNDVSPKDRDLAMVFQNYALFPHLNVFENMAFALKFRKVPKSEIRKRVEEAAEMLNLSSLLKRKPDTLSGGQRQRVAVGRTMVRRPKLFLFDEPLSNLDAEMRVALRGELKRLHQSFNSTMIYVTHDQSEAMTLGDRICILNHGSIVQTGTPGAVYQKPVNMFAGRFLGNPGMNFLKGTLVIDHGKSAFLLTGARSSFPISLENPPDLNSEICLGIRPESVSFEPTGAVNPSSVVFEAGLEIVENLGHESLFHLDLFGQSVKARISSSKPMVASGPGVVRFAFRDMHWFDAKTEKRLSA